MSMLLHACCGPCSMYPLHLLTEGGRDLVVLWYNPNIHPEFEWKRRLENLHIACDNYNVNLIEIEGFEEEYWRSGEYLKDYPSRCAMCYDKRMDVVARYAAENGYDSFCTTLFVSPYQQHELIKSTCEAKADKYDVAFEYMDFRPGFREGQNMAREIGLYRQKYCGCCFSLDESEFKDKILKSML